MLTYSCRSNQGGSTSSASGAKRSASANTPGSGKKAGKKDRKAGALPLSAEVNEVDDLTETAKVLSFSPLPQRSGQKPRSVEDVSESEDEGVAVPLSEAKQIDAKEADRLVAEQLADVLFDEMEEIQEKRNEVATKVREQLKVLPAAQVEESFDNQGIPHSKELGLFGRTMYVAVLPSSGKPPRDEEEIQEFMKSAQAALQWADGPMGIWGRDQRHNQYAEDGRRGLLRGRSNNGPEKYKKLLELIRRHGKA